jgi:tripartite-type tricarboxylate transporter receptor subunit TctC
MTDTVTRGVRAVILPRQGEPHRPDRRRRVLGAGLAWGASGLLPARAQDTAAYPARPVRVIVPTVAGGALDNVARMLAQRMSERLGQQFIIENRPGGAGGTIGMDAVAKAAPDGYTLLFAAAPIALNTALGIKLPYDARRDFAPISLVASIPALFAVHPGTPYRTLADVVEDSKKRPDGVSYAVATIGAITHLIGEAWKARTGANLTMIAYKGAGQAIQDVMAGTVPVFLDALIPTGTQVAAGKLRGIGIASTRRSPLLPDVPTVVEQGLPELVGSGFYGLLAPARTAPEVVSKLHATVLAAIDGSDMRERLVKQGYEVLASTPQGYTDFIIGEIDRWTPVVKAAGIKVE